MKKTEIDVDVEIKDIDYMNNITYNHIILINAMLVINEHYIKEFENSNTYKTDRIYLEALCMEESNLYNEICFSLFTEEMIMNSIDKPFALKGCLIDYLTHSLDVNDKAILVIPKNKKSYQFLDSEIPCLIVEKSENLDEAISKITEIDNRIYERERMFSSLFYKNIKLKYAGIHILDEIVLLYKINSFLKERIKLDELPDAVIEAEKVKRILEYHAFDTIEHRAFYDNPTKALVPNNLVEFFLLANEIESVSTNWYNRAMELRLTSDYKPGFTLIEKSSKSANLKSFSFFEEEMEDENFVELSEVDIRVSDSSIQRLKESIKNLMELLIMNIIPNMQNCGIEMDLLTARLKIELRALEQEKAVFDIKTILGDGFPDYAYITRCRYYELKEAVEFLLDCDYCNTGYECYSTGFMYPEIIESTELRNDTYLLRIKWIPAADKINEKWENRNV